MPVLVSSGGTPERLSTVAEAAEVLPTTTTPPSTAQEKGEQP
jgi:hypothetical protein